MREFKHCKPFVLPRPRLSFGVQIGLLFLVGWSTIILLSILVLPWIAKVFLNYWHWVMK